MGVAGTAFLLVYVIFRHRWFYAKIQQRFPKNRDYFREIGYSFLTIGVFTLVGLSIFKGPLAPYKRWYESIGDAAIQFGSLSDGGWLYWIVSVLIMILVHDAYFYWTHRAMHHRRLYRYVHLVHHKSTNPTPLAAFAFHPIEAFVEAGIFYVIVFTIPAHHSAFIAFFFFMMFFNVYGHLGYELYPKGWTRHPFGKWLNTSVNHNMHHHHFNGNYGLYFTWWDRWMGTTHPDYFERYDEVKQRKSPIIQHP
jgi:sterol desaturase/sphingolipid hydroxylase (fatty acid hydroxylase superfamily)